MTTFSPMLACGGGGISFGPVGDALIGITVIMWFVSAAVAVPNLIMSFRAGQSVASRGGSLGFFILYVVMSLTLWTGMAARTLPEMSGLLISVVLFFFVPGMVIGHFGYLFFVRLKKRRAQKLRDQAMAEGAAQPGGVR